MGDKHIFLHDSKRTTNFVAVLLFFAPFFFFFGGGVDIYGLGCTSARQIQGSFKKYKDSSDAKNKQRETKPWNFYDAFHDAVKDKSEISLKHIRESGACKRDLHDDKVFSLFLLHNYLALS
jgi:hypothetical protein